MKSTLVVVADLACYKAYRVEAGNHHSHPRLELLEHYDSPEAHGKLVDKVTDMSGQFPRGITAGAMSDGERHNIELEFRKRLVRQLAQRLNLLARNDEYERCLLAASREINNLLVGELDPKVRAKIQKNVPSDLTKVEKSELLAFF